VADTGQNLLLAGCRPDFGVNSITGVSGVANGEKNSEDDGRQDGSRGTNQTGVKQYNERLVLSLIRAHGSLSKGDLSRLTGLSAQASSVITKQLENEGLLRRGEPLRGKVGQPSIPFSLNPEGAFSIGCKIGRRSADLTLMDMVGTTKQTLRTNYDYPTPGFLTSFLTEGVERLSGDLTRNQYARIRGIGIAAPNEMWSWEQEFGAPSDVIEAWRQFDIRAEVQTAFSWPIYCYNDATAACAAEFTFGDGHRYPDFLYIFLATLVGGGVVLDGSLHPGRQGYAGSIGSALVPSSEPGQTSQRLIRNASLYLLERAVRENGMDTAFLFQRSDDWSHLGPILDAWIERATDGLAFAIGSAISVIDFGTVVIDGAFPPAVRAEIVRRTREKFASIELQGVAPTVIVEGSIGSDARVLGAASLPLLAEYARDKDILFN